MPKRKLKIYLDSTVPNYVFNAEYSEKQTAAKALLNCVQEEKAGLFISPVTVFEINAASEPRRSEMLELLKGITLFQNTAEAEELAKYYIKGNVFTKTNREDARHVAYAVYYRVDIIASYNFTHIVKFSTIKKLQAVNLLLGFPTPEIRSPEEIDI